MQHPPLTFDDLDYEEKMESPIPTVHGKVRLDSPFQKKLLAMTSFSKEQGSSSESSNSPMWDLLTQYRQTFTNNNHDSMLDFFSPTEATSSEWEEGVAVIESILMPQSPTYQALSPSQVQGLRKVQQLLIMGGTSTDAKQAHIPKELLQGRHEPGSTSDYILAQFAGFKQVNAKQRFLGVINAQRFIQRLNLKASSSRRLKVADKEAFILPEWTRLTPAEQVELCHLLSWDQLQQWDFDVFALERLTHGQPLLFMGWAILASPYSQFVMDYTTKAYRNSNNNNNSDNTVNNEKEDKDNQRNDASSDNVNSKNIDNEAWPSSDKTESSCDHHKDDDNTECSPSLDKAPERRISISINMRKDDNNNIPKSPCKNASNDPSEGMPTLDSFKGYGFVDTFKIPQEYLINFLRQVEQQYVADNPYHNNIHAADVVQSLHSMLQGMNAKALACCELELFSLLLAAVVHDIGHPGRNNSFQIHSHSDLAIQYNDISVLENMHASLAFKLLLGAEQQADLNIFWGMSEEQVASVRKMVIDSVLDTDMTHHFSSVNKIKGIRLAYKNKKKEEGQQQQQQHHPQTKQPLKYKDDEALQILHYVLHLADISNQAKPLPLAIQWTDRCLEEFFLQGDEEKRRGLPVSPLCDRMTTHRAESQLGFIKFVVQPAFEVLGKIVPEVKDQILPILDANLHYWKEQKQEDDISEFLEIHE